MAVAADNKVRSACHCALQYAIIIRIIRDGVQNKIRIHYTGAFLELHLYRACAIPVPE